MNGHEARRMTKLILRDIFPLADGKDVNSISRILSTTSLRMPDTEHLICPVKA